MFASDPERTSCLDPAEDEQPAPRSLYRIPGAYFVESGGPPIFV
jgi:hypothetical protein